MRALPELKRTHKIFFDNNWLGAFLGGQRSRQALAAIEQFLQRTDIISTHAVMQYVNEDVTPRFRSKNLWFGVWRNGNFDGDTIDRGLFAGWFGTTANARQPAASAIAVPVP